MIVAPTSDRALQIAAEVIHLSSRESPADDVLRLELKKRNGISPSESRRIAELVFNYYRWLGWLEAAQPVPDQLQVAIALRERFTTRPASFIDEEMLSKAVPGWVCDEMQVSPAWVRSLQTKSKLWLRARAGRATELAAKLGDCVAFGGRGMPDALEYRGVRDLFGTEEFHKGEFELQDINSQIVGRLCDARPGECWWDACTGPGGKMLHLSDLMRNKGSIWATDRAEWRLARLKRRAARAQVFNYRAALWDGSASRPTGVKFDGVLLDAPCSGIGTWQRNPHARWTTTPGDVRELKAKQLELLRNVASALKTGGRLVYAVCTLTRAETDGVADSFMREFPKWESIPMVNPARPDQPASARITLQPQEWGGNGMFIATWRKCG